MFRADTTSYASDLEYRSRAAIRMIFLPKPQQPRWAESAYVKNVYIFMQNKTYCFKWYDFLYIDQCSKTKEWGLYRKHNHTWLCGNSHHFDHILKHAKHHEQAFIKAALQEIDELFEKNVLSNK